MHRSGVTTNARLLDLAGPSAASTNGSVTTATTLAVLSAFTESRGSASATPSSGSRVSRARNDESTATPPMSSQRFAEPQRVTCDECEERPLGRRGTHQCGPAVRESPVPYGRIHCGNGRDTTRPSSFWIWRNRGRRAAWCYPRSRGHSPGPRRGPDRSETCCRQRAKSECCSRPAMRSVSRAMSARITPTSASTRRSYSAVTRRDIALRMPSPIRAGERAHHAKGGEEARAKAH